MKKYYYIYKITFLKGRMKGQYYIGMHTGNNSDLVNDGYFGSGIVCTRYYKKYPPVIGETITKEILEECDSKEQLAEREKFWIGDLWKTDEMCVNMKRGGEGGYGSSWCKGCKLSKEHRQKLSNANKGKHLSDETKRKMSATTKGRKLSDEHRKKISESNKGKIGPFKGKHLSDETKRKLSSLNKGKHHTEETKQKMREAWKRRKAAQKAA